MKKEIIYLLLDDYADHEAVFLAQAVRSDEYSLKPNPKYENKVAAPTLNPVKSIGGFRTIPDYSFDTIPEEYAALVLIGGYGWLTETAKSVAPIVRKALEKGIIVGAICNAASFMAQQGFLNQARHTGNGLDQLKLWGGKNYTNEAGYEHCQAVSDRGIVTANGTGQLEFARELLLLLKSDSPERIEAFYHFNKIGFTEMTKHHD